MASGLENKKATNISHGLHPKTCDLLMGGLVTTGEHFLGQWFPPRILAEYFEEYKMQTTLKITAEFPCCL